MRTYRPSIRLFWLLGFVVLAASAAGASWISTNSSPEKPTTPSASGAANMAVCFGHVDLEHGVLSLTPVVAGRVVQVPAQETKEVEKGAVLVQLDDRLARLRVQEAEADLAAGQEQLVQAQKLPEQHQAQVAQQGAALESVRKRLAGARHELAEVKKLAGQELINAAKVEIAKAGVEQLAAMERAEEAKLKELGFVDPQASVRRAQADVNAKQARLAQARRSAEECQLLAPDDGTVLRVLVGPGDVLSGQPSQAAVLFCPKGERLVRAEVEQEFAGRVEVGHPALIQDDTKAGHTWTGKVQRVSDWYTHRRSILQEPFQFNDVRTLECLVSLDPGQPPLRIGQRVRVTIGHQAP